MVLESTSLMQHNGKLFNVTSVCIMLCRKFQQTGLRKMSCHISLQRHLTLPYTDFQHFAGSAV